MNNIRSLAEIFFIFIRLGLTSFGGPVAHLGFFRQEFVIRRKWLDEHVYGDLVSLCQFLPGPASSQVGMAIGMSRGGIPGAVAAWLGFTLPSAAALVVFGLWFSRFGNGLGSGWIHGLKVVTVAVVAQAVLGMSRSLCPDYPRRIIAIIAAAIAIMFPTILGQMGVMIAGGLVGFLFLKPSQEPPHNFIRTAISKKVGAIFLSVFFILLFLLPAAATVSNSYAIKLFDGFYRAGSLVFGGGHVVLPLLQSQVVPQGWVSNDTFLAGYGAAQAVPGPLFTFAAYLGAVSKENPSGWMGATIALIAIFLPAFLLIAGTLPFWEYLRRFQPVQKAMMGINASIVGILLAALYNPVITNSIHSVLDWCAAVGAFALLMFCRRVPWVVILLIGGAAIFYHSIGT